MMEQSMWECGAINIPHANGRDVFISNQDHCKPLMEALVGLSRNDHGEESDFAAGTRLDAKGVETIYIEHKNGSQVARVELRPNKVRASIANAAMGMAISKVQDVKEIAAAVWYAYLAFDPSGQVKSETKDIKELTEALFEGVEDDEKEDFELKLTNFEAKAMLVCGPITGAETSVPVLDKKVQGPSKIVTGEFMTFPGKAKATDTGANGRKATNAELDKNLIETTQLKEFVSNLTFDQEARVPKEDPNHVAGYPELYMFRRFHDSAGDPGLEAKSALLIGPPASGKTQIFVNFCAKHHLPAYSKVFSKNWTPDDMREQVVPYIHSTGAPVNFTAEETAVNRALNEDRSGRDAGIIAREALDFPSTIEIKFDPECAIDILGPEAADKTHHELDQLIADKARSVVKSIKQKIESSGVGREFLGFKVLSTDFMNWFMYGGGFEFSEWSLANPAELGWLHDVTDFAKDCYLDTAFGTVKRHPCCYAFFTSNTDGEENNRMSAPMLSRMCVPIRVPAPSIAETTDRLCKTLGCESKRVKAQQIIDAYQAIVSEAKHRSLPGELDFRQLKQIGNAILMHGYDPREVFEMEVLTHFLCFSDIYDRVDDELAFQSILDEHDLFR